MLRRCRDTPFVPIKFMKEHKGMQGTEYLEGAELKEAIHNWSVSCTDAMYNAQHLSESGVTKQLCNRLLEPFMWHTVICSATEWQNFFALRAHEAAEIHIQKIAYMMLDAYNHNTPTKLKWGEWHIPFGDQMDEDRIKELGQTKLQHLQKVKIATARCHRISYLNYEGKDDYEKDIVLHDNGVKMGHWSPFEHCAVAYAKSSGNFNGWLQYRKTFQNENRKDPRVK